MRLATSIAIIALEMLLKTTYLDETDTVTDTDTDTDTEPPTHVIYRAGKKLEVKVRDSVSQVLMGGETWSKFKLKKDPTGAAKFQDDIDHSTDRHELVDVIKNRRRDEDTGSPVRYEKTTVKLEFPRTDPVNGLTGSYYSGRSWVRFSFINNLLHSFCVMWYFFV